MIYFSVSVCVCVRERGVYEGQCVWMCNGMSEGEGVCVECICV